METCNDIKEITKNRRREIKRREREFIILKKKENKDKS